MTAKLVFEHLSKRYGRTTAVDDLSLEVSPGSIFGVIGRNGAGKTTALSCALGLARPSSGRVWHDGRELSPDYLNEIAYVPEMPSLYGWMTGAQHIEMHTRAYRNFDVVGARHMAETFELALNKRSRTLSKGQKQALALLLAFSRRASLIVLDEPASGLDPVMQRQLLDLIVQAGADGKTVIFSSHQIGQIERAAETIAIIDRGKLALMGHLDELRENIKVVEAIFPDGTIERRRVTCNAPEIERQLLASDAVSVRTLNQSLEDIFLTTISGSEK